MSKHKQFVASLLALAFLCCAGIFPMVGGMGAAQLSGTQSLRPAEQGASLAPNGGERETASASGSLSPTSNDGATGSSVLRPEGSVQTGPVVGGSLVPEPSGSGGTEGSLSLEPGGSGGGEGSLSPESGGSSGGGEGSLSPESGGSSGGGEGSLSPESGSGETAESGSGTESLAPEQEGEEGALSGGAEGGPAIMPMSIPWGADSIIVETYAEFADALSNNNGYNTIYLGADISGDYSGAPNILIDASKRNVVIDGQDPRPGGQRHSYTSRRSSSDTGSIYIRSADVQSITFQNIDIIGLAYYGICQFNNSSTYAANNFKVTVKNATYTGPQMFWGADVILRMEDLEYTSSSGSGTGALNEVAELRSLELAGRVNISHSAASGISSFWFRNGSASSSVERYIRVEQGAQVDFVTNSYFMAVTSSPNPNITIENGARLNITAPKMHRSNSEAYNNFTVQDGGSFSFTRTGTDSDYGLSFEGALTVGNGGTFIIKSTSSRAALYLNASAASASFVEPAFVQLYNASGPIMGFSSSGRPLSISADTVNMWQGSATDTDSINNMPTAIWNKADTATPVTISLSYTSGGAPTGIVNSDLGTLDPVIEGVAANMNMNSARQITMGKFTLNGPIKTSGASGNTEPNADMYMAYGSPSTRVTGVADGAGAYLLEPPGGGTIALNEEVIVLSHKGMLKARNRKLAELDPTRTVRFEQVPSIMSFGTVNIGAVEQTIPRVDPAWSIQIYDGRGAGSAWRVQAAITGPLSSGSDTLPNALVYMNGGIVTPFSATEQLIYNGVTAGNHSTPGAYTDISWPPTDGPMLIVGPGQGMVGQTYQTTLVWTLYDAP